MSLATEYQHLYNATSIHLGLLEAKVRGEKVPEEAWNNSSKLFQRAIEFPYRRFKLYPKPHYNLDDILELLTAYLGEAVDMDKTLNDLVAAEDILKERKELQNAVPS